jgi:6-pyruvoyltetrahydropterin/6-carboxytetrahydropterin synthase
MNLFQNQICIRKEYLKFSAAHLTIFPDGSHERLHGHNYSTEVRIGLKEIRFEKMTPFAGIKEAIQVICDEWDERVLIATQNPFLTLKPQINHPPEIEFLIGKKRYLLPKDDVVLLPLDNITTETLAAEGCRRLVSSLSEKMEFKLIRSIEFRVEESPGQGATCTWEST